MVQRPAHVVEPVLGLDHDFVETLLDSPGFLLLGQRSKVALPAPVPARSANPGIAHVPPLESYIVPQSTYEIDELRLVLDDRDLVGHLEGHRHDGARVVGQWSGRQQDQSRTTVQSAHDLGCRLLARKLAEVFFDVLDFERALLELVLRDVIFHGSKRELYTKPAADPRRPGSPWMRRLWTFSSRMGDSDRVVHRLGQRSCIVDHHTEGTREDGSADLRRRA